MKKKIIRLTESDLHRIVKNTVKRILKENNEMGNSYQLVVEMSPQTLASEEDTKDYETVDNFVEQGNYKSAFNYMMQWEYGEDLGSRVQSLDSYDEILYEDGENVLTYCPSKYFGYQGNAYFLYRKV